jgi:hypothetical protein
VVEIAPEVYQNARIFTKAIQRKTSLGEGDLEVFQALKRTLSRLGDYYLGVSILFMASAATLSYVWPPVYDVYYALRQWLSAQIIGLTPEAGVLAHAQALWMVMTFLFTIIVVFIQIIVWKARSKLLGYGQ